jgi:hypothetical protein
MIAFVWRFHFELGDLRTWFWRIGGRVEKMKFSLKTSKWMYGLDTGCMVRSITVDVRP